MHLFGTMGFISLFLGIIINLYLLVLKIMGEDIWGKPILLLGMILLLGGIQLITIGILAEVSMRTYYESGSKKTYQVRNLFKLTDKEATRQQGKEEIQAVLSGNPKLETGN